MTLLGQFKPVSSARGQSTVEFAILFYYNFTVDCPLAEETGLKDPRSVINV